MNNQFVCENCSIDFDSQKALNNHQAKFCVNSNYGNIDNLQKQFTSLSQERDISMYGKMALAKEGVKYDISQNKSMKDSNVDAEYQNLLKQINNNQTLKAKLQRQKQEAFNKLKMLDKKQNELLIENKRNDLQQIIKKRDQLARQEDQLQKQIRQFQNNKFNNSMAQSQTKKIDDDFVYRQGREAGKLAMQRKLLQEKKRQIQTDLKHKKREGEKIQKFLNSSQVSQHIYIPDYQQRDAFQNRKMQTAPSEQKQYPKEVQKLSGKASVAQPAASQVNQRQSMARSNASKISIQEDTQFFLKPDLFTGQHKTLFQSLNPQNKTDQDIFLQTLVAQEFDALNVLAKLPKNSEIYTVKLQQYQQMSKIRQEYKDKIQRKRLQKVKREFEYQKKITEVEKNNLMWLDHNRKDMLNKEAEILREHEAKKQMENKMKSLQLSKKSTAKQLSNLLSLEGNILNTNESPSKRSMQRQSQKYVQRVNPAIGPDSNWGYKIELKQLKHYTNGKPIKFKLVLKQEFNPDFEQGLVAQFQTAYHDESAPRSSRDPYHPNSKNRLDEFDNIIYNQTFLINNNLQATYNKNQREMYLYVIALEKDAAKMTNQPSIHSWYCLKITHFGQLKEGIFTFNLYEDQIPYPLSADMNKKKRKLQEEVIIELTQVILEKPKPPKEPEPLPISKSSIPSQNIFSNNSNLSIQNTLKPVTSKSKKSEKKTNKTMKIKAATTHQSISKLIDKEYFIDNQDPITFSPYQNLEPLNLDFGISCLRFLPSYVGPIKLQISFIDGDGNRIFQKEQILGELGKDMYNPTINFHKILKNFTDLTVTSFVLIRILTISTLNYEIVMLGFSMFNLFYEQDGLPIINDEINKGFLINGHFQIPIYWGSPEIGFLVLEDVNIMYPAIPCASMLISINQSQQGQIEPQPFPDYSQGCYNTMLIYVTKTDAKLFVDQNKREKLNTNHYVEGFLKFKGITKEYKDKQLLKFLSQSLSFNRENTEHLMRLNAMAEYNPSFGIHFNIDKIIFPKSKQKYYYFCTSCVSPPANYYLQKSNDLDFLYKIDINNSKVNEIILEEGEITYNVNYNENLALIVEVYRFKMLSNDTIDKNLEHCGHCIIPLFDPQQSVPCANALVQTIGLVDGQFQTEHLRELQTQLVNYLQTYNQKKKNEFKLSIRVTNGFFLDQFIPVPLENDKAKEYKTLFTSTKGFKSVLKLVQKQIKDQFGVQL